MIAHIRNWIVLLFILTIARSFRLGSRSFERSRGSSLMYFEDAENGNTILTADSLKAERYLASNRFNVKKNAMARFEKRWAERKSRLATLPGFRFFSLFKRTTLPGMPESDEPINYISFTIWDNKEHFEVWRKGDAFKEAHGGGLTDFVKLLNTALFIVNGSPKPAFYDALLVQQGEKLTFATDNGWRSVKADGENLLAPEIFMAQNRFKVLPEKRVDFEQTWANRESKLQEVPGFVGFSLFRRDADKADDGFNYISSSIWKSAQDFNNWRNSPEFQQAHSKAGNTVKHYEESPKIAFYEGKLTLCSDRGY